MADLVAPSGILHSEKLVTTAGTRVTLGSGNIRSIVVKALSTNTGLIYIGGPGVSSANGYPLAANETISISLTQLGTINIDSSVNGEGIRYFAVK